VYQTPPTNDAHMRRVRARIAEVHAELQPLQGPEHVNSKAQLDGRSKLWALTRDHTEALNARINVRDAGKTPPTKQ